MNKRAILYVVLTALFVIASAYHARFIQRRLQAPADRENLVLNQLEAAPSGRMNNGFSQKSK